MTLTRDAGGEVWPSDDRAAISDTRACPECGRPQHYTGTELGWCHDATFDTWHCADPETWHPGKVDA